MLGVNRTLINCRRAITAQNLNKMARAGNYSQDRRYSDWTYTLMDVYHYPSSPLVASPPVSSTLGHWLRRIALDLLDVFSTGILFTTKRTFQPSIIRRKRKHGYLARLRTKDGRKVLLRRKTKGRKLLCP